MPVRRLPLLLFILVAIILAPIAGAPLTARAARSSYFDQTGHNVAEPFLGFFQQQGGIAIFGLPLTEGFPDGNLTIQYFERARLEYHPDYAPGKQIEIGQIGRELSADRANDPAFRPLTGPSGGGTYFAATGHTLHGGFADYWTSNGGLTIFGLPLSEESTENVAGAGALTVQYFERARLELHPGPGGTARVELGLLGVRSFTQRGYPRALLARAQPALAPQPRALTIPVLEYHDVGFGVGTYQVTMAAFTQQLDWLQANGYHVVTLQEVYGYVFEGGDLPSKPVVLTFDDGRASQWNAVRELNARGMRGVFFVLGSSNALSDAQIRQMVAQGHEIESHSMSHPQLSRLSDSQLAYEIVRSKQSLEAKYGVPIRYFAYPYGDYNQRVIDAVAAAGYEGGIAAWGGGAWTPQKRWQEPRILIDGNASLSQFAALVRGATP